MRYLNDDELEECVCTINHRNDGFEDQEVYIWYSNYKGKFARVKQMNGNFCKVELETPLFGESIVCHRRSEFARVRRPIVKYYPLLTYSS